MTLSDWVLLVFLLAAIAAAVGLYLRLRRLQARTAQAYAERAEALATLAQTAGTLERERQHLAALGEATSDALLLLDANRQIEWGNQAAWDMFSGGQPAAGRTFIALVRDHELNQAVADAIAGNRPMIRQTETGSRLLRIWASPIQGTGGVAVTLEDVTELQRLGRARRDFVANISHELRTPLANIDLAAQTLRGAVPADAGLTGRMLDQIQTQVLTLSQLSQEMLELAQIESGQVLLRLVPAELAPVVQRCVAGLLPQASRKGQRIAISVPAGLMALLDEQQIARAIGNLIHNGIKFTPERGAITISAEVAGDDIQVSVSDTGPGIPLEEQGRVFERFYKADRARSRGGTGLGLAIARHIVEGHGGRIWIESTPGQGAAFHFTLPRA